MGPNTEIETSSQEGGCMKTEPYDAMMSDINDGETMASELEIDLSVDYEQNDEDSHEMVDTENNVNALDPLIDCSIDIEENQIEAEPEHSIGSDFTNSSVDMEESTNVHEDNDDVDASQDSIDTQALRSVFDSDSDDEE